MSGNPKTWPSRSSGRLERIRKEIAWEVNNQSTLKARAKDQYEHILELGLGDDPKAKAARSEYVLTLFRIKASKVRMKRLEAMLLSTIDNARQPSLWEHEEDIPKRITSDASAFNLLTEKDEEGEKEEPGDD